MRILPLALLTALAWPAHAGGTLEQRMVTLGVLTYDDPKAPILHSNGRTVMVGEGVEFGLGPEYRTPGFDIVPVQIEITPDSIEFSYGEESGTGTFWVAGFNGYVLNFEVRCTLFERVTIDPAVTTMDIRPGDITTTGSELFINVSGRDYGPGVRLKLDLEVGDCPMS